MGDLRRRGASSTAAMRWWSGGAFIGFAKVPAKQRPRLSRDVTAVQPGLSPGTELMETPL